MSKKYLEDENFYGYGSNYGYGDYPFDEYPRQLTESEIFKIKKNTWFEKVLQKLGWEKSE